MGEDSSIDPLYVQFTYSNHTLDMDAYLSSFFGQPVCHAPTVAGHVAIAMTTRSGPYNAPPPSRRKAQSKPASTTY